MDKSNLFLSTIQWMSVGLFLLILLNRIPVAALVVSQITKKVFKETLGSLSWLWIGVIKFFSGVVMSVLQGVLVLVCIIFSPVILVVLMNSTSLIAQIWIRSVRTLKRRFFKGGLKDEKGSELQYRR